jgi:cytochrome c5
MRHLAFVLLVAACTNTALPAPTGAVCPTPDPNTLTWDNFGQKFMADYCTACHDSSLPHAQRNGAPLYHDYNTLTGVLETIDHVDQYAGSGPSAHNTRMPPSGCPTDKGGAINRGCPVPTDAERTNLSIWLACERARPH